MFVVGWITTFKIGCITVEQFWKLYTIWMMSSLRRMIRAGFEWHGQGGQVDGVWMINSRKRKFSISRQIHTHKIAILLVWISYIKTPKSFEVERLHINFIFYSYWFSFYILFYQWQHYQYYLVWPILYFIIYTAFLNILEKGK